jgi:uncharacterized protein involved in cysteine biosynthesis
MLSLAFARAFRQLAEPSLRTVLLKAVGLAAALYLLLALGTGWLASEYLAGWLTGYDWLSWASQALVWLLSILLLLLLFPVLVTALLGLCLDAVATAVERRHYPADSPGRELPAKVALAVSLRFLAVALVLNLLALPLYLAAFWLPMVNFVVFFGLNGYLLGREYFELVSLRHVSPGEATLLRRRHRWRVFLAGLAIALLLTVPFVNLAGPVVATAAMVHVFKRLRAFRRV